MRFRVSGWEGTTSAIKLSDSPPGTSFCLRQVHAGDPAAGSQDTGLGPLTPRLGPFGLFQVRFWTLVDGPIWMAFLRKRSDPGLHLAQVTGHWSVSFWLVFAPSFQREFRTSLLGRCRRCRVLLTADFSWAGFGQL